MRRLAGVELLILDDFALQPLDATETADFYQLCVERHQRASTVVTSNRTAEEWLAMMADPLLAQSAVDRLVSTAHELVIEGESYRRRQKPSINHTRRPGPLTTRKETTMITHDLRWSLPRGNPLVPSRWQATVRLSANYLCPERRGQMTVGAILEGTRTGFKKCPDLQFLVELSGLEPLTSCMPSGGRTSTRVYPCRSPSSRVPARPHASG